MEKKPSYAAVSDHPIDLLRNLYISPELPDVGGFMVSSSVRERGEALWLSRYRSTKGCCIWLGSMPVNRENIILCFTKIFRVGGNWGIDQLSCWIRH